MIRIFNQLVSLKTVVLIQTEALTILFSFIAAVKLWFWNDPSGLALRAPWPYFFYRCLIHIVLLQLCFYYSGLYDVRNARTGARQLAGLTRASGALCLGLLAFNLLAPSLSVGNGVTILALTLALVGVFAARFFLDRWWQTAAPTRDLLVLGTGAMATALTQEIRQREDLNFNISAFATQDALTSDAGAAEFLGRPVVRMGNLLQEVSKRRVSRIVVATENRDEFPVADLVSLRLRGVTIDAAHDIIEALSGRVRLDATFPSEFLAEVTKDGLRLSRFTIIWKRSLDLFLGLVGLVITSPVIALTALIVWLESGKPILYRQTRVGLGGREFQLLKFRSMHVNAEPNGEPQWARSNDPRTTRVGGFLRAYRLDELPQFVNVIQGQMSFVGPRPERPCFVAQLRCVTPYYEARLLVRPGVTGWAQVEFPYARTTSDAVRKLEYDLFYLKNMSFAFDCAIALKTLKTVLLGWGNQ